MLRDGGDYSKKLKMKHKKSRKLKKKRMKDRKNRKSIELESGAAHKRRLARQH
jgi:hypothetical protein